jgi:hypothetical protein
VEWLKCKTLGQTPVMPKKKKKKKKVNERKCWFFEKINKIGRRSKLIKLKMKRGYYNEANEIQRIIVEYFE